MLSVIAVAGISPNEDSLLRLATAVLIEFDEDWTSGKRYLAMKTPSLVSAIYRTTIALSVFSSQLTATRLPIDGPERRAMSRHTAPFA